MLWNINQFVYFKTPTKVANFTCKRYWDDNPENWEFPCHIFDTRQQQSLKWFKTKWFFDMVRSNKPGKRLSRGSFEVRSTAKHAVSLKTSSLFALKTIVKMGDRTHEASATFKPVPNPIRYHIIQFEIFLESSRIRISFLNTGYHCIHGSATNWFTSI